MESLGIMQLLLTKPTSEEECNQHINTDNKERIKYFQDYYKED